jgi:hypothetical protein
MSFPSLFLSAGTLNSNSTVLPIISLAASIEYTQPISTTRNVSSPILC